jgi:tetratricopeptide (TPR) repeat protein
MLCLGLVLACFKNDGSHAATNSDALLKQAEALLHQKKYTQALERYEKLLTQDPALIDAYRGVVACYAGLGDSQGALIFMESLFLDYPDRGEVSYGMGYALFSLQKYTEAARYFDQALRQNPELAEAWNNRAAIYQFIEKDDHNARRFYEKAIALARQTGNRRVLEIAEQNLAHIPREQILSPVSEPLSMEQFINRFVAAVEEQNHKAIRELVLGQKHNSELAMEWLLEEALKTMLQEQEEKQNSALLLARLLEKEYFKAFNDPSLKNKLNVFDLDEEGRHQLVQAEKHFQEGLTCEEQHIYDEASKHYEKALAGFKALKVGRKTGIACVYLGDVNDKLQRYAAAQKAYADALPYFDKPADAAYKARILASLGQTCFKAEDYKSALEYMEQSLEMYRQLKQDDEVQKLEKNIEIVQSKAKVGSSEKSRE